MDLAVNLDLPDGRFYFKLRVEWQKPALEWRDLMPEIEAAAKRALAAWESEQKTAAAAYRQTQALEELVADACAEVASGEISVTFVRREPPFTIILGSAIEDGKKFWYTLSEKDRAKHLYVVGQSGAGKSTFLKNLAYQDMHFGRGVLFIDPDGDAAVDLLDHIPPHRVQDTIYFEPTTIPIGLAVFDTASDTERQQLADDLHALLRRFSETWGERMDAIARFAIATLLRMPGSTLLDLYYLLDFEDFRNRIVSQMTDPLIVRYWRETYANYPSNAAEPILSRLAKFALNDHLKPIAGSTRAINFHELLARRGILIVNLSLVGGEVDAIIGSFLISQLQLAIRRRAARMPHERLPFSLYVDEFQVFYNPAIERLITQARKHNCSLVLAHHYPHQIDDKIRRTISGTFGNVFSFRLSDEDARVVAPMLRQEPKTLTKLSDGTVFARRGQNVDWWFTHPFKPDHSGSAAEIIRRTKERYPPSYAERETSPADYDYDVGSEEGT